MYKRQSLNIPETAKKETIIEPELTPMGNNLPTRPEYVTPPTYWDKLKENLPLMAVGTGMGVLYGVNVISNNILRRRQSQMTDGLLALPPSQERNDRSLIASSSAGPQRVAGRSLTNPELERQLDRANNLVNMFVMGEGDQVAQNLAEELTTRTRQLRELEERREQELIDLRGGSGSAVLERARSRAYDGLLKTNDPVNFKPIDVPHSHEEELRLDRLAREQREGGIVLQSNQMTPARPSTTLTSGLAPEWRTRLANELTEIESDFYAMMDNICLLYTSPSPRD